MCVFFGNRLFTMEKELGLKENVLFLFNGMSPPLSYKIKINYDPNDLGQSSISILSFTVTVIVKRKTRDYQNQETFVVSKSDLNHVVHLYC